MDKSWVRWGFAFDTSLYPDETHPSFDKKISIVYQHLACRYGGRMEVPTHLELLNPALRALHTLGGSASIEELAEQVIKDIQPLQEVIQQRHARGRGTELEYRLAWARTYLKKFGLINNSERGVWSLTPLGANVETVDAREVQRSVNRQVRQSTELTVPPSTEDEDSPSQVEDAGDETAPWREELLEALLRMPPSGFERLCQRLLRESGFIEVEVTGRSGDGGIDGHGIIRVGGLISFPVLFQCKRYRDNIGPSTVRDFRGAMVGRADKGLLITTGSFTRDARLEATRDGAPPIDLIGSDLLVDKLRELELGVKARMVEVVEVDTEWLKSL